MSQISEKEFSQQQSCVVRDHNHLFHLLFSHFLKSCNERWFKIIIKILFSNKYNISRNTSMDLMSEIMLYGLVPLFLSEILPKNFI